MSSNTLCNIIFNYESIIEFAISLLLFDIIMFSINDRDFYYKKLDLLYINY